MELKKGVWMIFDLPDFDDHEAVVIVREPKSRLSAVIAIHDTTLGPAHGGTRCWSYRNDKSAMVDALRLSRGMTYKNAVAELPFGGGKSVILLSEGQRKTKRMLEAFGDAVEQLSGRYILAEDVGIGPKDVSIIATRTKYASGVPKKGWEDRADPSPHTARGVFLSIQAGLKHKFGSSDLSGKKVLVQGLGGVGTNLCKHLAEHGTQIIATDLDPKRMAAAAKAYGARTVAPRSIMRMTADVFAPCALGAILNDKTIPKLKRCRYMRWR